MWCVIDQCAQKKKSWIHHCTEWHKIITEGGTIVSPTVYIELRYDLYCAETIIWYLGLFYGHIVLLRMIIRFSTTVGKLRCENVRKIRYPIFSRSLIDNNTVQLSKSASRRWCAATSNNASNGLLYIVVNRFAMSEILSSERIIYTRVVFFSSVRRPSELQTKKPLPRSRLSLPLRRHYRRLCSRLSSR